MSFTHLQVRSSYSLFQSTMSIRDIVEQAHTLQYDAIALTDNRVLYGAVSFYETCKQYGIKPIFGLMVPLYIEDDIYKVLLYAKNEAGYQTLIQLSTQLETENIDAFSNIDGENLLCIIPSLQKEKSFIWEKELLQQVYEGVLAFFQEENMYIGVSPQDLVGKTPEEIYHLDEVSPCTIVAINDVRYKEKNDYIAFDCLQAMKNNEQWSPNHIEEESTRFMMSEEEMATYMQQQVWLDRTEEIVQQCNVHIQLGQALLPTYPVPNGMDATAYLRYLCEEQLSNRYRENIHEARERMEEELAIIQQLQFDDYFLIVQDFVRYAKEKGIIVGPGRGSAAGSIVSYLLQITEVDPLEHGLLFERFLNPNRVSMPDIDIDFSDNRREEVLHYIREKYGSDYVAQIITFGTYAARSLLRDLMKALDVGEADEQYILRHIPHSDMKIVDIVKQSTSFATYIKNSPKLKQLFTIAVKLEGLPRHISTHAAGIIIGKYRLQENVPLTIGANGNYMTQYAMQELEKIGLLKMDILGLRNLSLLERIVQSIAQNDRTKIAIQQIGENDPFTYELLQAGNTNGIFQLESDGMKDVLRRLRPTNLADIVTVISLYRPGPMDYIPTYIARKNKEENITYIHEDLRPILEETYGVLVYQEQIMQIAHRFAGLSLGEADILRRAVSKKNVVEMNQMKEKFLDGCQQKGYPLSVGEEVFSWIVKFANYGFNKSHAVSYSKISYQLSYLKANYPLHFYAQIINSVIHDKKKVLIYLEEAKQAGIPIKPPSVNKSYPYFTVEGESIRIGFLMMQGIGYETASLVVTGREVGPYKDLFDFTVRCPKLKRKALESFILVGAFDHLYANRASLLASIDEAYERTELSTSLFQGKMEMHNDYVEIEDFTLMQKLQDEKEILQWYVSEHPLQNIRPYLQKEAMLATKDIYQKNDRTQVTLVGLIESISKTNTKRGESMAFVTVSDEYQSFDIVLFPDAYRQVSHWLKEEIMVQITGRVDSFKGKKQLIGNELTAFNIEEWLEKRQQRLYIKLHPEKEKEEQIQFLRKMSQQHPGNIAIVIYDEKEKKAYKLDEAYHLQITEPLMKRLFTFFGEKAVVLK